MIGSPTIPTQTSAILVCSSETLKENPVNKRKIAIIGNVKSKRFLLPTVSIVQTAGRANRKLTIPKAIDVNKACLSEKQFNVKI